MEIRERQLAYMAVASRLGKYQELQKTELAVGFCIADQAYRKAKAEGDAKEMQLQENLRSAYWAALMLRYWYKIFEWLHNSSSLCLEPTEFVDWLEESFDVVFRYRSFFYPFKAVVKNGEFVDWEYDENGDKIPNPYYYETDSDAPDKIINKCCFSTRGRWYQYYNKQKRKGGVHRTSLDGMLDEDGDCAAMYSGAYEEAPQTSGVGQIIEALLKKGECLEALIVEGMCSPRALKDVKEKVSYTVFNDESQEEEVVEHTKEREVYDDKKLVKHLSNMSEDYLNKFCKTYSVTLDNQNKLKLQLNKMNNQKWYKNIQKVKIEIAQNPTLLNCLYDY